MWALGNRFEITSALPVDVDALWAHCSSMEGVGRELRPLLRMTYPDGAESLVPQPFVPGERLFRSTILLFGVLPVDWSDLTLVELDVGSRFLERSPMATQRLWEHERLLEPFENGTRITDRLTWEGKTPALTRLFAAFVPLLFRWRHHRLGQIFGAVAHGIE